MRRFLSFWSHCVRRAARGSTSFANAWQWSLGVPIFAYFAGPGKMLVDSPIVNALIAAAVAFVLTWTIRFFVQLVNAPVMLHEDDLAELSSLRARLTPNLQLEFDPSIPGCIEVTKSPPDRALTVRVLPTTTSRVENCKGQLLKIWESLDGIEWRLTNFIDALDLRWTHQNYDPAPMRIARDVPQTLDVFYITERDGVLHPATLSLLDLLPTLLAKNGSSST